MENTEVKKSLPIEVVGRATYANNEPGNYLIVRFKNIYDEERKITIPAEEVEQLSRLKKRLINHGYNLSNLHSWSDVKNILSDPPRTIERMDLVRTTGFHNGVFLLSDNQIIGKVPENKNRPFMDPDLLKGYLIDSPKGKLQDWKEHIASSGKYSSRIMLALSATFSAPLLHLTNIESGGFHFYGTSSTGKTTCQKIASSIQGSADNVESWSTTETGAEETAAKFNGSMLAYDELGSLDGDPRLAAQKATILVYKLAFGKEKKRSGAYSIDRLTWKIILLSSGEYSLSDHAVAGGKAHNLGEKVRLIDIPADAGCGMGIYESLSEGIQPAVFSNELVEYCNQFYGVARQKFIAKLLHEISNSSECEMKEKISLAINEFLEKHKVDKSKGAFTRISMKFALAYAGGKLAAEYKILPFDAKLVMLGVSKCYKDALKSMPKTTEDLVDDAYNIVREELKKGKLFLNILPKDPISKLEDLKRTGRYATVIKEKEVRAMTQNVLTKLVPDILIRNKVLQRFCQETRLLCDAEGKKTRQIKLYYVDGDEQMSKTIRAYCFTSVK